MLGEDGQPAMGFAAERWVGGGRTIRKNRGLPVKQYEPFFPSGPTTKTRRCPGWDAGAGGLLAVVRAELRYGGQSAGK